MRCEDSVANSEAVVCRPHRVPFDAVYGIVEGLTILSVYGEFSIGKLSATACVDGMARGRRGRWTAFESQDEASARGRIVWAPSLYF